MRVRIAENEDYRPWLCLAAEVEPLFGPMVREPRFQQALRRNIGRRTAFCVREDDDAPGASLLGGLLFSPTPPLYTIGWLAVAEAYRRQGIGRLLVEYVVRQVRPPAEMVVTTFGRDLAGGYAARQFYERMGFKPAEMVACAPDGSARQIYRRLFE
jgi:GNAT superfamily N-acetyltransferase